MPTAHWGRTVLANSPGRQRTHLPLTLLYGIHAVFADDVWAVGCVAEYGQICTRSLIEYWNGRADERS